MRRARICWDCVRAGLNEIHLVDKFLIAFMLLLLLQSAYNLIVNHAGAGESGNIDVIVRTSTAAIFGYFLSTNFIRRAVFGSGGGKRKSAASTPAGNIDGLQSRIEFSSPTPVEEGTGLGGADFAEGGASEDSAASTLQVIVASAIGFFCLAVLILIRNVPGIDTTASASATATVAQFRDIVSGCIGFLIGCPTPIQKNLK